jgi:cell fate regulator YaaT (PSP1 superfamily)
MAQLLLESHPLPIKLVTAECQFDRNKITIYYDTQVTRVDFREFVRDLYSTFKTRIWMQKIVHSFPNDMRATRLSAVLKFSFSQLFFYF